MKVRNQAVGHMNIVETAVKILREEGVAKLAKKSLRYVLGSVILFLPYVLYKIRFFKQDNDLNKLISFVFDSLGGFFRPSQIQNEILELLKRIEGKKPKVVVEIGTGRGGTLFLFSRCVSEDAIIISVDFPGGRFGSGYPKWKIPLYKSFAMGEQKIHLIRANSHLSATLEKVRVLLDDKQVDFLFIDGDHSYDGVKQDFQMYGSLVKKGSIIALHDIVPAPKENVGGVPEFWRQIKDNYETEQIVKEWSQGGYGIGVVYV